MKEAASRPEVIEVTEVEQRVDRDVSVRLTKERWRIGELSLVRKYAVRGGPPVVLVHGFAQNRYTWHTSRRSMSAWLAARGYDVYNLELRGHGNSRGGSSADKFENYVDDLVQVATTLGEPAFWLGHSLGGAVVYAGATRVPMRGIVGIGALFSFAQHNAALNALCQLTEALRGKRIFGALNLRTRLAGRVLSRLYALSDLAGYTFPISGWAPGSMEPELLAERLEHGFDWTSAEVWFEMARWGVRGTFSYADAWKSVRAPLLVIGGDLDHLMLPDDARVAYDQSESPDKTWTLLDDWHTGHHWGHLDLLLGRHAPTVSWPLIADWMASR